MTATKNAHVHQVQPSIPLISESIPEEEIRFSIGEKFLWHFLDANNQTGIRQILSHCGTSLSILSVTEDSPAFIKLMRHNEQLGLQ
jgi:hypothetical protein